MSTSFAQQYGPWALVTGASSGIGQAIARQLAARGLNLILCARNAQALDEQAEELRQQHEIDAQPLALDIGASDFVTKLVDGIGDRDLGLVVSNAGFGLKGLHIDQDPNELDAMLAVNARAPMQIIRAIAPQLIQRGRGGFILTGSMEGYMGFPLSAAYSATKGFVHFLGEAMWQELKPHNIDVLTLAPGSTDTSALTKQGIDKGELSGLMSPDRVATEVLENLGKRRLYMPGSTNRFLIWFMTHLPRKWGLILAEKGMQSALKH